MMSSRCIKAAVAGSVCLSRVFSLVAACSQNSLFVIDNIIVDVVIRASPGSIVRFYCVFSFLTSVIIRKY